MVSKGYKKKVQEEISFFSFKWKRRKSAFKSCWLAT